jgi:threonine dehydrogenase-like Zn-dependent dehydrogenase
VTVVRSLLLLFFSSRERQLCTLATEEVNLPSQARVVVCGGGVIGTSVAYHLSLRGWNDVVVLEQGQ